MKRVLLAASLCLIAIIHTPTLLAAAKTAALTASFADQQLDAKNKTDTGSGNKISSENRKEAERLYKTGVQLGIKGNYTEAVEKFLQSIAINPLNPDTRFSLGHAYLDMERWREGIDALKEALRLQPKDAEAYQLIGFAQSKLGDYKQAVESFRQAVLLKPDWAEARYNLGNAFYKLGQYSAAVGYYTEVTAFKGNEADPFNDLGAAYAQMGNHDNEAFQAFKRAIHLKSNHAPAHNNIGLIHYRQGNYIEAADAFKRALAIKPDDPVIRRNLDLAVAKLAHDSSGAVIETVASKNASASGARSIESNQWLARTVLDPAPGVVVPPPSTNTQTNTSFAASATKAIHPPQQSAAPATQTSAPQKTSPPVKVSSKAVEASSKGNKEIAAKSSPTTEKTVGSSNAAPTNDLAAKTNTPPRVEIKSESRLDSKSDTKNDPKSDPKTAVKPVAKTAETGSSPTTGSAANSKTTPPATTVVAPTSIYRIGAGDMLDIRLLNMPSNDSTLYTVLAGGFLEYPFLEAPLMVSGLTTDEIDARLTAELERRNVVKDPEVVVSVREYASHVVIVSGLVNDPGNKVLRREAIPLYVVLADAQPKPEAGRVEITSHQNGQRTVVDLSDQAASNMLIYAGDVLNVVTQPQMFYYIGGNVAEPGQKDFHNGLTLTQAILAAGGSLQEGAGSSKNWTKSVLTVGVVPPTSKTELRVTRQSADGRLSTLKYSLREIMTGRIPDPALQAGDRIEVGK